MGRTVSVIVRGGSVFLLLLVLGLFMQSTGARGEPATAGHRVAGTCVSDCIAAGGLGMWIVLALGAAILVATPLGIRAARREGASTHWSPLVRGLGEAAFLVALLTALIGTWAGMDMIVRLGAAVTPGDLASGIGLTAFTLMVGTAMALLGLLGAGAVRLASRR